MRSSIIEYLNGSTKKEQASFEGDDKVSKILYLLQEIEHTPEEEELILQAFIDQKSSKITADKIKNKLHYIRQKKRLFLIEEALNVRINTLDCLEFTHTFTFDFADERFSKLLLCVSEPVKLDVLMQQSDEAAIKHLLQIKQQTVAQKEQEIDALVSALQNKRHRYLSLKEAKEALKKMPPDVSLQEAPIALPTLERIVKEIDDRLMLCKEHQRFIVEIHKDKKLFHTLLPYKVEVEYADRYLYHAIQLEQDLTILEDIQSADEDLNARFDIAIDDLLERMRELASKIKLEESFMQEFILRFLAPHIHSSKRLRIKEKLKRTILYHFGEHIKPLLEKQKKEALLAQTIRDFKQLFPPARSLGRRITFHVGPTNSGKTYAALERLKQADTGYYLAPLRLLALEGYESLKKSGINASLITGEEEIIDEDSTHVSSTIEMMNAGVEVDVCVIDEIQMIGDRDRGWAWANALIGAPAKEVILTGSENVLEVVKALCDYLDEELEIKRFERKNPLEVMSRPTPLHKVEPQSAIVAFSRRDVLALKLQLSRHYNVSVVYGNLSPEVRREEARRFREGESEILVATDAIAMGLNLPIKTILFAKDNKFDGLKRRELTSSEVTQIAGRAGRYGMEDVGYVGALDHATLKTIKELMHTPVPPVELPVAVMASLDHALLIGEILDTDNLTQILEFFANNMEFEGPFVAANIDSMLEIAAIVDNYNLDLKSKYHLSCAPATLSSPYIDQVFHRYIKHMEAGKPVPYKGPKSMPPIATTNEMLLLAEDRVREISLYLWLSFKFPDFFPDTQKAIRTRTLLNEFIENSLRKGDFSKRCRKCGKTLGFNYKFSICDSCFNKRNRRKHYGT